MSPRRILLMAHKEVWHIVRDLRTVYLAFVIPFVFLLLFGYALTMDIENLRLIVVDREKSALSRDLAARFEHSTLFTVVERPEDPKRIEQAFFRRTATAALVIPERLSRDLERGEEARVQLIVDGTNANEASIAVGYGKGIGQYLTLQYTREALARQGVVAGRQNATPIRIKTRNWFNQALRSQWYLVPGLIAVIMAMMTSVLMSLTVAREWEQGTMEQLLVTPLARSEIVLGKLIPYYFIGIGQLVLIAGAGVILFDLPIRGNMLLLFGGASLFLLGGLGQGLLISVVTRKQEAAMQMSILTSMLPSFLLSGFLSPIASMPYLIQKLTYAIPARYFLVLLRGVFLKGTGLDALFFEAGALLAFAVLMLGLSAGRFKTRLD